MLANYKGNIAIVHDWFSGEFKGGAEKVFKEIEEIINKNNSYYEIFCLVNHLNKNNKFNKGKVINSSFIQNLPFSRKHFHN